MDLIDFTLRLGAALLAGLFIGIERELRNKDAGVKTNALVSLGAAVFVMASLHFQDFTGVDITRVLGQVVTGIGFIGAGVILHRGDTVQGLTTAATVWCSAGAGSLAAIGLFEELAVLSGMIIFVNVVFGAIDTFISRNVSDKSPED